MAAGAHSEGAPDRVTAAQRATKIVALRASGASWTQAAHAVGYRNASSAQRVVKRWINRQSFEDRELMRQIEGARFDRLQMALWPRALTGDVQAIDRILKISHARREMFGLNAPQRVVIENEWLDSEIRELCAELGVQDPRNLGQAGPVVEAPAIEGATEA